VTAATAPVHRCHADGCAVPVPPKMLMCRHHWYMVPKILRDWVWATYRSGQEIDKQPSAEYMDAHRAAVNAVAAAEARPLPFPDAVPGPTITPTTVINLRDHAAVMAATRARTFVRIDRATRWGNPFVVGRDGTPDEVIDKYTVWIDTQPELLAAIPALRGCVLGCWCAPLPCHGYVLAAMADAEDEEPTP
jgi:hypothetical protein